MSGQSENVPMVTSAELSMVEHNLLTEKQLGYLLARTPEKYIYERPAKGGGKWKYVKGVYVKKVLNLMFGWDWDFQVLEHKFDLNIGQAYVLGRLTCRITNLDGVRHTIIKEQFGRVDIKFRTEWVEDSNGKKSKQPTTDPLDIGNDLKAATTDALKKCAAELGVAADVYSPDEFHEVRVVSEDTKAEHLAKLYDEVGEHLTEEDRMNVERIIEQSETNSYSKAIKLLTRFKQQIEQ